MSLEQRKLTTKREKAGELHYSKRPGPYELETLRNELVPNRMLREKPAQPEPELTALAAHMKRQPKGQQTLEDQTRNQSRKVQPRADLKVAALPPIRNGHQLSFDEESRKQRARAPGMPTPSLQKKSPKPAVAQLTEQIERQMRPRTPGRKRGLRRPGITGHKHR